MPALTKAARKAVGVPKAVSLDDGTKLKRKLEKSKLDRVLDKEIALPSVNCAPSSVALPAGPSLPAMPSCLPHRKDTKATEHEECARDQEAPAAAEVGRAADRCDGEADDVLHSGEIPTGAGVCVHEQCTNADHYRAGIVRRRHARAGVACGQRL